MRSLARKLYFAFNDQGVDLLRLGRSLRGLLPFLRDALRYVRAGDGRLPLRVRDVRPILHDRYESAGVARGHYFHQDLWAARKIFERKPRRHVDVGSSIYGFVSHVLTFMPVEVIDVRPLPSATPGLVFVQENGTELARFPDRSLPSISSLHAVEHFGLGRYGDPVDPSACFRAMRALARVLQEDGRLYFGVPIGRERVEFNAHRIFSPSSILREFAELELVSFSAVNDDGDLALDADPTQYETARYACGLFEFTRRRSTAGS